MTDKLPGVIEKLTDRGFGFAKVDGYPKAIFFHSQQVRNTTFDELKEGDKILVNRIVEGEKGLSIEGLYLEE